MYEQSKAAKRRFSDGNFHSKYFVGSGIDVGAGTDSLAINAPVFRGITEIRGWDQEDGDAQTLASVADGTYNFLHSSHCLEHMINIQTSMVNWIRVVKPGGYLVITIPDEDMYEQGHWPSIYNEDHKHTFTIHKNKSWSPVSINVVDLIKQFSDKIQVERIQYVTDFFVEGSMVDQTYTLPNVESAIEMVLRVK